jgi:hypothetical protein
VRTKLARVHILDHAAVARASHISLVMNVAPLVAYLVAGFLVLGILLSALALWLFG